MSEEGATAVKLGFLAELAEEIEQLRSALQAMRGPFRDYVHAAGPADERDIAILAQAASALGEGVSE